MQLSCGVPEACDDVRCVALHTKKAICNVKSDSITQKHNANAQYLGLKVCDLIV